MILNFGGASSEVLLGSGQFQDIDKFHNQLNRRYFLRRFVKPFMAFETVRQIIKNDEYRLQPFPLLFVYDETNNWRPSSDR